MRLGICNQIERNILLTWWGVYFSGCTSNCGKFSLAHLILLLVFHALVVNNDRGDMEMAILLDIEAGPSRLLKQLC